MSRRFNPYKMFVGSFIPNWLKCRTELNGTTKLIYAQLCQFAGENGECYPSTDKIAKEVGLHPKKVFPHLKKLRDLKLIETTRRGLGMTNLYHFLEHEWMNTYRSNQTVTTGDNQTVTCVGNQTVTQRESVKRIIEDSTNTPLTPRGEPTGKEVSSKFTKLKNESHFLKVCERQFSQLGRSAMFHKLKDNLVEFYQYRKQVTKKHPLKTEVAVVKMVNKLVEESFQDARTAAKMIDATIVSEKWTGIFPVNGGNGNGKKSNGKGWVELMDWGENG